MNNSFAARGSVGEVTELCLRSEGFFSDDFSSLYKSTSESPMISSIPIIAGFRMTDPGLSLLLPAVFKG